jgi:hypothetical protein
MGRPRSPSSKKRHGRAKKSGDVMRQTDLKFVLVDIDDLHTGGWYRELPDHRIEVMSRARLERVPLKDADPEEKAREVVATIVRRQTRKRRSPGKSFPARSPSRKS